MDRGAKRARTASPRSPQGGGGAEDDPEELRREVFRLRALVQEAADAREEADVRADVEEATRREQEEMEAEALEKIRREGEEHADRLGKVAFLRRRAEEKRAEAAKRKNANAERTARLDSAAETSRAVLSAGDTSDSDSDAPPTFSRGLAMDWRAKRV